MKTKIETLHKVNGSKVHYIDLPAKVLEVLGWKTGDTLSLDVPMTGGAMLCVEKKG